MLHYSKRLFLCAICYFVADSQYDFAYIMYMELGTMFDSTLLNHLLELDSIYTTF